MLVVASNNPIGVALTLVYSSLAWPDRFFRFSLGVRNGKKAVWPRELGI